MSEHPPARLLPRVQRVSADLLASYQTISASTLGHITDFGYVQGVQPLFRPLRILGNAITVKLPTVDGSILREALLQSQAGDVLVIAMTGEEQRACWGELRTLAALRKQLAGVVISGCATDVRAITELGFPVFCSGVSALTTRALQLGGELNTSVSVGGVSVQAGDLVVGDDDGVFILDPEYAQQIAPLALAKQEQERERRAQLIG